MAGTGFRSGRGAGVSLIVFALLWASQAGGSATVAACLDDDGDGYGINGDPSCPAGPVPDCDDTNGSVYPGAPQVCDGLNNACDDSLWPSILGDWSEHPITTTANGATSVSAADMDGDQDPDLLAVARFDSTVTWYENAAGDASAWTEHVISATAHLAESVVAADVDDDGDLDALAASFNDSTVAWHENTAGDGSAWAEHVISVTEDDRPRDVSGGDIDGDGDQDALVGHYRSVVWHENTAGNGSAWTTRAIATGLISVRSVFVADVDGDDDLDALSASAEDDRVAWYENVGDGSVWTTHAITNEAIGAYSVFAADVDGDDDLDVLSASYNDDTVAWHENTAGDGSAWTKHVISVTEYDPRSVFAADIDGDGDLDALSGTSDHEAVVWYENTAGDGSVWTKHAIVTGATFDSYSVFAADLDGDGDLDALSGYQSGYTIAWHEAESIEELDRDGDGVAACHGDCDDANADCLSDCTDADEDGFCVTTDCDETVETCMDDCATDLDADGTPDCADTCIDIDEDGYGEAGGAGDTCVAADCDDSVATCTVDCVTDVDADGMLDCADTCLDFDGDGFGTAGGAGNSCVAADCDDTLFYCTVDCTDADGDGHCVTADCDEGNPDCTTDCTDADEDGYCVTADCDESDPDCVGLDCSDADDDGLRICEGDCDGDNPYCTTDCADADADGYCVTTDCDESNPNCTVDCTDADGDGYCAPHDCDDSKENCTDDCTDTDGDGFAVCDGDCDDTNAAAQPGLDEICTDTADNDCDGLADAADARCSGLVATDLAFESHEALSWTAASSADSHGLYRGAIPPTGWSGYNHLCEATALAGTTAEDPDLPGPSEGFYYLVTGQSRDVPGDDFVSGPLGLGPTQGSRPDSGTIPCGPRVYVDPDLIVGERDGLSWATAYSAVSVALGHDSFADRGLEVWVRGTVNESNVVAHSIARPGIRLLGGFSGTEEGSWERTAETPTIWSGTPGTPLITLDGASLVLEDLTLRSASAALVATPAGRLIQLTDVGLEQISDYALDLVFTRSAGSSLVVRGVTFDTGGFGGLRAIAEAGLLTGQVRDNVFRNHTDAALRLEARSQVSAEVGLDVVGNVISGGGSGIVLGAHLNDGASTVVQSSFLGSNVVQGTSGSPVIVEADGLFVFVWDPALVEARPLLVGNTLSDGGGAGVRCTATRLGIVDNHEVRCRPELWDNLITFNAGAGIEESTDDPATGLEADPVVIGNGLHGNLVPYVDEGTLDLLTIAEVNALAGAYDNFGGDPLFEDHLGGDHHLEPGTVLGLNSAVRYLANSSDPGVGLSWTEPLFADVGWPTGAYGIGYDQEGAASRLLRTIVPAGTRSVYSRIEFEVANPGEVQMLTLGAEYDDGYVVWLNGEIYRSPSMPGGAPGWDTSPAEHESSNGALPSYVEVDVTATGLSLLVPGTNVLAAGVWNSSAASPDLVLLPRLTLNEDSPAIDAGHLEAPRMTGVDIDGEARTADGRLDGISRPDAGADERVP